MNPLQEFLMWVHQVIECRKVKGSLYAFLGEMDAYIAIYDLVKKLNDSNPKSR